MADAAAGSPRGDRPPRRASGRCATGMRSMSFSASSIGLRAAWSCARSASDFSRSWSSSDGLSGSAMFVGCFHVGRSPDRGSIYDNSIAPRPMRAGRAATRMQTPCPSRLTCQSEIGPLRRPCAHAGRHCRCPGAAFAGRCGGFGRHRAMPIQCFVVRVPPFLPCRLPPHGAARDCRRHAPIRRLHCRRRRQPVDRGRGVLHAARAVRLRQDDAAADDRGLRPPRRRAHRARRPGPGRPAARARGRCGRCSRATRCSRT